MILIPQYRTARRAAYMPPLDEWTSGIISAYSTRQLLTSYTGALLRVRRSSDSTEQDIGQIGGALDTVSLLSFVGAGTGSVVTWYDQKGSNNATGIATLPQIVISGTLQQIAGGAHPSVYVATDASSGFSGLPSFAFLDSRTVISRMSITSGGYQVLLTSGSNSRYAGVYQNGSCGIVSDGTDRSAQYIDGSSATRDQAHDGLVANDGVLACSFRTNSAWTGNQILSYNSASLIALAQVTDFVLFNSELSAGNVATVSASMGA